MTAQQEKIVKVLGSLKVSYLSKDCLHVIHSANEPYPPLKDCEIYLVEKHVVERLKEVLK